MKKECLFLDKWVYYNDKLVKLTYEDGSELYIDKTVFNRSFQPIISNEKSVLIRDFAEDIQLHCG